MKQEDRELLLRDLCARLSHRVKLWHESFEDVIILHAIDATQSAVEISNNDSENDDIWWNSVEQVKPYLFPLSSMTEEIMDEIYNNAGVYDIGIDSPVHIEVGNTFEDLTKIFDILHKHHIDYRGLISMGLAVDATNLNVY